MAASQAHQIGLIPSRKATDPECLPRPGYPALEMKARLRVGGIDDIRSVLWEKFIALSALSVTTSLLRAPMGDILAHPEN